MIVEYTPESDVRLTDPFDFCGFKLVLKGLLGGVPTLRRIAIVDQDNALVSIDLLPNLPECPKGDRSGT